MTRPKWMLTAFEPFAGRGRNFSAMILEQMRDPRVGTRLLPVVFDALGAEIAATLDSRPHALVLMGETRERDCVRVERLALNVLDAGARPDNRGGAPSECPVVPGESLARPATWDAPRVVHTLRAAGVPARISYHAGTYACNQALYLALSQAEARGVRIPIGFLHVPGGARGLKTKARQIADALPALFAALTGPTTSTSTPMPTPPTSTSA